MRKLLLLGMVGVAVATVYGHAIGESTSKDGNCRPGIIWFPHGGCVGDATEGDVLQGVSFSSDKGSSLTGTMVNNGAMTITPSATDQNIPEGYHNGSGAVAGDSDLSSDNIKSGIFIFGVEGDPKVVDTSSGTAVSGEIMEGKKAWVGGAEITGSLSTQTLDDDNDTVSAGFYIETTLSAVDNDLAAGNIKKGITIFGVAGDKDVVDTSSGDAVAGDILTTKKAWVDGVEVNGNVPAGANVSGEDGSKTFTITDGLYSGSKTATVHDTDLVAGNIRSGINIFGVVGTIPTTSCISLATQYQAFDLCVVVCEHVNDFFDLCEWDVCPYYFGYTSEWARLYGCK